jgi:hypothetical protein
MIEPHRVLGAVIEGGEDVGPASALWSGGVDAAAWRDAADECRHGRLPGDNTPPCGCWPQEPEPEPEQEEPTMQETPQAPKRRTRKRKPGRKPMLTEKEAGTLLPKVVREIDAEIARLESARQEIIDAVRSIGA